MINRRGRRYGQQEGEKGEEVWSTGGGGGMINRRGRRYDQQEEEV